MSCSPSSRATTTPSSLRSMRISLGSMSAGGYPRCPLRHGARRYTQGMAIDAALRPMLARPGPLPRDPDRWGFEVKWDGVRALAHVRGGVVELRARTGRDVTPRYPELASLPGPDVVLDG